VLREKLIRRFRQLWILELVNAFVIFPFVLFTLYEWTQPSLFVLLALAAVDALLVIGAAYGYLKMRDLQHGTQRLQHYERHFLRLKRTVPFALLAILLAALPDVLTLNSGEAFRALMPGILLYGLAVLEYINYFHTQLMYDNRSDLRALLTTRRLKPGLIAREYGWLNSRL
jgi:membrane protein YqaA with SNARE-associated domain